MRDDGLWSKKLKNHKERILSILIEKVSEDVGFWTFDCAQAYKFRTSEV